MSQFRKLQGPASCPFLPFPLLLQKGCAEEQALRPCRGQSQSGHHLPGRAARRSEGRRAALGPPHTRHTLGTVTCNITAGPTTFLQETQSCSHFAVGESELSEAKCFAQDVPARTLSAGCKSTAVPVPQPLTLSSSPGDTAPPLHRGNTQVTHLQSLSPPLPFPTSSKLSAMNFHLLSKNPRGYPK